MSKLAVLMLIYLVTGCGNSSPLVAYLYEKADPNCDAQLSGCNLKQTSKIMFNVNKLNNSVTFRAEIKNRTISNHYGAFTNCMVIDDLNFKCDELTLEDAIFIAHKNPFSQYPLISSSKLYYALSFTGSLNPPEARK